MKILLQIDVNLPDKYKKVAIIADFLLTYRAIGQVMFGRAKAGAPLSWLRR